MRSTTSKHWTNVNKLMTFQLCSVLAIHVSLLLLKPKLTEDSTPVLTPVSVHPDLSHNMELAFSAEAGSRQGTARRPALSIAASWIRCDFEKVTWPLSASFVPAVKTRRTVLIIRLSNDSEVLLGLMRQNKAESSKERCDRGTNELLLSISDTLHKILPNPENKLDNFGRTINSLGPLGNELVH